MLAPKHLTKCVKGDYRLIAISDIHGHLDRFKALLKKVQYRPREDYLVILGDFIEKGDQVLETIHYVMELSKLPRVYVLTGNCEWALCAIMSEPELAKEIPLYLKRVSSNGIVRTLYNEGHYEDGHETPLGIQRDIARKLHDELLFCEHLPTTLKFNDFIFVHAGLEPREDYKQCGLSSYLEFQHFMDYGHLLKETVIVGHLPTSNYREGQINNDILYDEKKRIISIDGGTGVKMISQLNALIITSKNGEVTFHQKKVQPLPKAIITKDYHPKYHDSHKIAFPYYKVEVLEEGTQFSKCYQEETHQILMIKNEFLYIRNKDYYCLDDYTDAFLDVKKQDEIALIGVYGQYAYGIYDGQVGWIPYHNIIIK